MIKDTIDLVNGGHDPFSIAYWVQEAIAESLSLLALDFAKSDNLPVVLSGGVSYNSILQQVFATSFKGQKTNLLINQNLPPGDGCISTGQIASALTKNT